MADLREAPPLPLWRRAAGALAPVAHSAREFLESAPEPLRPAAFLPWFLLNLQNLPEALERTEAYGARRRFSTPTEVLAGAPTERTLAGDLAQMVFAAGGVQPTAQLGRAAGRLPLHALNRAFEGPGPLAAQVGAVKGPGGEWSEHPIKMVASALRQGGANTPEPDWADRMARNYFNKHLGTEQDPVKDLRIRTPAGLERRWEELTDDILSSKPRRAYYNVSDVPRLREEPMWSVEMAPYYGPEYHPARLREWAEYGPVVDQFYQQMEDVGRYLKEDVPTKRGQYDFPRAFREQREKAARAELEVSKNRIEAMEGLETRKEYPGTGLRWLEHQTPSALSEAQFATVTKNEDPRVSIFPWIARDSAGNPIKDVFYNRVAGGFSPENAWTSGKLTREANDMRHCSGSTEYCAGLARGERRMLSLRDEAGVPYVTFEAWKKEPKAPLTATEWGLREVRNRQGYLALGEARKRLKRMDDLGKAAYERSIAETPAYKEYLQKFDPGLPQFEVKQIQGREGFTKGVPKEFEPYVDDLINTEFGGQLHKGLLKWRRE